MDPILNGLLKPRSIAIIGASATPGKIGNTVIRNLIESEYKGGIYPVNPSAVEILGFKCYPAVTDIPYVVDAAVITVPAKYVLDATKQCGEKGVKGLIIITSGFAEVGEIELEHEIVRVAKSYGMRILGPNIVGTLSNSDKMNASFAPFLPLAGKASLVSQSGALLIAMDAATYTRRVGFDKMVSIGNMSDVNFSELISYLSEDPDTSCIALYVEGLRDGPDFIKAARNCKTHRRAEVRRFRARRGCCGFTHRLAGRCRQDLHHRFQTSRRDPGDRPERLVRPHPGALITAPYEG